MTGIQAVCLLPVVQHGMLLSKLYHMIVPVLEHTALSMIIINCTMAGNGLNPKPAIGFLLSSVGNPTVKTKNML
jgi:hypothetical protein